MNGKLAILTAIASLLVPAWAEMQTLPAPADDNHAAVTETREERDARMDWWRKAKFGMFIHYGLYSGLGGEFMGQPGGSEWIQKNLELDTDTYAREARKHFQPAEGCTEEWAALAEDAGCQYMVFTTKHHEGFAMYDTKESDYNSVAFTGRDITREFVESARKHGMRVGFYHSVIDWHHPAYDNTICPDLCYPKRQARKLKRQGIPRDHEAYQQFLHNQVRELLTNYGKIDIIWWDYSQGAAEGARGWKAPQLMDMCRELQPGIIMNNRLYAFSGFDEACDTMDLDLRCGDYTSPEKRIPAQGYPGLDWEACMTVGDKWGFNRYDVNIKSPATIIRQLEECAAKGGNLLLNIGPMGDGTVPAAIAEVFHRVGDWMRVNGEAIYESTPCPYLHLPEGWMSSMVYDTIYIFPPEMETLPAEPVVLRLPTNDLPQVTLEILGQPDCKVTIQHVEEPGETEPQIFSEITIPAEAWANAVEHMPVLRLLNDN